MLKALTGLGGMAINETSEADSYFTGELRPGATVDSEDNERICTPELGQEEDDRLGASEMLKALTGLGGMAINETSEADSYPTGELRPGATVDSEDNERICTCTPKLGRRGRRQARRIRNA